MQITEFDEDNFWIIKVAGDVDAASAINLDKSIEKAINQGKKQIILDGTSLQYIASAGLGVFVSHIEEFKEKKVYFALFGLSDKVKNVFQILGLDKLLKIVVTKEEAKRV
jgi:anti-sigma B factor antagonist